MRYLVVLLTLGLSGCAQQWAQQDDALCQSYGAAPGSQAYMQCRMAQDGRRDQQRAAIAQSLGSMQPMQGPAAPPAAPTYRCQTAFGATTCAPQ